MIGILITIVIIHAVIYITIRSSEDVEKDKKYGFRNYFFIVTIFGIFLIFYLKVHQPFLLQKWQIFLLLFITLFVYFKYILGNKKTITDKVVAKQMSYWGIPKERILEAYRDRIVKKRGRNEVEVEEESYFTRLNANREKELEPLIFADIAQTPDFHLVRDVKAIRETGKELYIKLLDKLEEINIEHEFGIDFEEKIKENKHILEFFFIDLWETVAYDENIGSTTLACLAEDESDTDLIYALDSAKNINVQKEGIGLFSHYLNFKGRLNDY